MHLTDVHFDKDGNPVWELPVPRQPWASRLGHALPYLHPGIKVKKVPASHRSERAQRWMGICVNFPVFVLCVLLVVALNFRRQQTATTGLSGWLQRLGYWCVTCWSMEPDEEPVQAAVMLPGKDEPFPVPIDVGLVEPMVVLWGMGIQTTFCCEGHPSHGYIALAAGHEFPPSLLKALDRAWLPYHLNHFNGGWALYDEGADFRFAAVLRAWAREQASEVLGNSKVRPPLQLQAAADHH